MVYLSQIISAFAYFYCFFKYLTKMLPDKSSTLRLQLSNKWIVSEDYKSTAYFTIWIQSLYSYFLLDFTNVAEFKHYKPIFSEDDTIICCYCACMQDLMNLSSTFAITEQLK